MATGGSEEKPWWTGLPEPTAPARVYKKENLLRQFIIMQDILNAGTLLIDLRRNDYEGGAIRGSLNMPAQSFYMNMATLYRLCQGDGVMTISRVMFYCGSSQGRGTRCAAWFNEYVAKISAAEEKHPSPDVFVLEGGIKGWVKGGEQYTQFIDGFRPDYWRQFEDMGQSVDRDQVVNGGGGAQEMGPA